MIVLALDAATYVGTVAVFDERRLAASGSAEMRGRESERLMPAVARALEEAGVTAGDLGAIVCGSGPGSFTSLRIAAAIAKGIAAARGIPLHGVSSLGLIVAANAADPGRYLAALDALRGESYIQPFRFADRKVEALGDPRRVPSGSLPALAAESGALLVGPGLERGWSPHAKGVGAFLPGLLGARPVDLASWEPSYGRQAEAEVKREAAHGRVPGG